MPIQYVDKLSVDLCRRNPHDLFVFGDNLLQRGRGGQAVIRHEPNVIGVPTKRAPSMEGAAFFSDRLGELKAVVEALILVEEALQGGRVVCVPQDGLGTGRAQLGKRSPLIYRFIKNTLTDMEKKWAL